MKSPCKQCLVSPCCTRRCNDKLDYNIQRADIEAKILDIVQDVIAFVVVFGLFFSPLWLRVAAAVIEIIE